MVRLEEEPGQFQAAPVLRRFAQRADGLVHSFEELVRVRAHDDHESVIGGRLAEPLWPEENHSATDGYVALQVVVRA